MGNRPPFRYRVEIWEIQGRRYHAQIWQEEEWGFLPAEQRPGTAMLVQGIGWVNLRPVEASKLPTPEDPEVSEVATAPYVTDGPGEEGSSDGEPRVSE